MVETMDETDIKKRLLEELQQQMAVRRVSPVLEIEISAGDGEHETEEMEGAPADEMGEGVPVDGNGTDLAEPTNVKDRLARLLKSRGMMD